MEKTRGGDLKSKVSERDFFSLLKDDFSIDLIYYPGSDTDDRLLLEVFGPRGVVMLDSDMLHNWDDKYDGKWIKEKSRLWHHMKGKPFVLAHQGEAPFKDGVFDAIYYKDNHSTEEDFSEMLRVLKAGGLFILGNVCEGKASDESTRRLQKVDLPYEIGWYSVYRKISREETIGDGQTAIGEFNHDFGIDDWD